ncbi:DUF1207 domain-containing protein [Nitrosovibrio tenuis]|uniref:DUF1207 domain-containing protein n=1 Tax=Nitrosovibrio tenuis TaxID=1233 RepID=UPI001FDFC13C|nr:DUF1207 domain-containing protein [Nitrosovibrio tenuis]
MPIVTTTTLISTILVFTSAFCTSTANAAISDDSYIAGYAAGVLKHSLKIDIPSLVVRNGIIAVPAGDLPAAERARIVQVLSGIPGVTAVQVVESTVQQPVITPPAPDVAITAEGIPATDAAVLPTGALPEGHLFKPLLADPRWAHFSAAYRNYVGRDIDGNNNGAVSFGETIPFYRANLAQPFFRSTVQWEAGLQAAVFSDFNLGGPSSDLINTDFIASAYSSMRVGHFSAFARVFHQSSHLGDEFLLRTRLQRINLSYEGADLRLSYEFPYGIRIYGGGGGIFHRDPSTLKPWTTQYGIEFRSPWRTRFASMRPIAAVDVKNHEQNNWNSDVSVRAGIQFDKFGAFGRRLQFLMEYFSGNSPTGQFYIQKVEYLGIGAHYHY